MTDREHWLREHVFAPGRAPVYGCLATHRQAVAEHDHAFVEIVLVLDGRARHVTQAGRAELRPGNVLILRPGVWHAYADVHSLTIYNCCFGSELLDRELAWTLEDPAVGPLLWGPRHGASHLSLPLNDIESAAAKFGEVTAPPSRATAIGGLLAFLGVLGESDRARPARERIIEPIVAQTIRRLETDLARPWHVNDLAQATAVSCAHLTRRFTEAMGLPPMAYLARYGAERAAALLLQTTRPIADIAAAVGWDDPVYFARRFRRHYAMPPREYRRRFGRP